MFFCVHVYSCLFLFNFVYSSLFLYILVFLTEDEVRIARRRNQIKFSKGFEYGGSVFIPEIG